MRVFVKDCVRSDGLDYRGKQQSSSSGLACLNWINITRDYDAEIHPDSQTGKQTVGSAEFRGYLVVQPEKT